MRLGFDYGDKHVKCVATDCNHMGLFVNTQVVPPIGYQLELKYEDRDGNTIAMRGPVVRVVHQTLRASRIPGMALAIEAISCTAGRAQIERFVQTELGADMAVFKESHFQETDDGAVLNLPDAEYGSVAARHVHEERLDESRSLPSDAEASDDLLRRFTRSNERRRNPRFPVHVEVSYYVGDIPYLGSVLNISQSSL